MENNLIRLPGRDPEGVILLVAHYDSMPGGPGAADNGSGVVLLLELLRTLQTGPQMQQDVIFLFSDGEEPGMIGAQALACGTASSRPGYGSFPFDSAPSGRNDLIPFTNAGIHGRDNWVRAYRSAVIRMADALYWHADRMVEMKLTRLATNQSWCLNPELGHRMRA